MTDVVMERKRAAVAEMDRKVERARLAAASTDDAEEQRLAMYEEWDATSECEEAFADADRLEARIAAILTAPRPELPPKPEPPAPRGRPKAAFIRQRW